MENFNRSIELNGSQLMGLYKEFNKLGPDLGYYPSRMNYPCMRELFGEIEDIINEYREGIHDEVMNFLEGNLEDLNGLVQQCPQDSDIMVQWRELYKKLQPLAQ